MKQAFIFFVFFTCFVCKAQNNELLEKTLKLDNETIWNRLAAIPLKFSGFHPQGMVKINDFFYMTAVEVTKSPKNGDTGVGYGHLFKFDSTGILLSKIILGEGDVYHPGGIDFDGENIWIPVAEYRPKSRSIIYKVEPKTMSVSEVFRFGDHIGGIVHDTKNGFLIGINWGSRSYYRWKIDKKGLVKNVKVSAIKNNSYYINFQDCHFIGSNKMLCSGLQKFNLPNGSAFRLGGFELINLLDFRPELQVPIKLWSPTGLSMTNNPFWVELSPRGLKAYFVPDDDKASTLFIYEAQIK